MKPFLKSIAEKVLVGVVLALVLAIPARGWIVSIIDAANRRLFPKTHVTFLDYNIDNIPPVGSPAEGILSPALPRDRGVNYIIVGFTNTPPGSKFVGAWAVVTGGAQYFPSFAHLYATVEANRVHLYHQLATGQAQVEMQVRVYALYEF